MSERVRRWFGPCIYTRWRAESEKRVGMDKAVNAMTVSPSGRQHVRIATRWTEMVEAGALAPTARWALVSIYAEPGRMRSGTEVLPRCYREPMLIMCRAQRYCFG